MGREPEQYTCYHAVRSLIIISRLDYRNSSLYGISRGHINRSQNFKIVVRCLYYYLSALKVPPVLFGSYTVTTQTAHPFQIAHACLQITTRRSSPYLTERLFPSWIRYREGLGSSSDKSHLQATYQHQGYRRQSTLHCRS